MGPSFRRRTKASVALNLSFSSVKKKSTGLVEDELYQLLLISGIECLIQASNTNGMIKGVVCTPMTSISFKFDFAPCQTRNINIKQEILRLYFNTKNQTNEKVQNPKVERDFTNASNEFDLVQKDNIEQALAVRNFLIQVTGSFQKRVNIEVETNLKDQSCTISTKIKD